MDSSSRKLNPGYAKLLLMKYYATHDPSTCFNEVSLSKELALALQARAEVNVPFKLGRADLLSKDWLIECKKGGTHAEKAALGQLLVYQFALKFKGNLGIGIIGKSGRPKPGTMLFCKANNIHIFYYNLHTRKWKYLC